MAKKKVTLAFIGDVILAREVESSIRKYGPGYIFERVAEVLREADLVLGNLECPISERGKALRFKNVVFNANPIVLSALACGNFAVMSIANNHIFDYGEEALLDTLVNLHQAGITPVGAGENKRQAYQPVIIKIVDLSVVFIAATWRCEATRRKKHQPQAAEMDFDVISSQIHALKSTNDIIVVSLHTGVEYFDYPIPEVRRSCLELLKCGADIIVGSHPHVLQGIERLNEKIVAYSLGNFVTPYLPEYGDNQRVWQSGILQVYIENRRISGYEFTPVKIRVSGQPYVLEGVEKNDALVEMDRLSALLGDSHIETNFWKLAGARSVEDTLPVLLKNFQEEGLSYIFEMLSRIRPKHLRLFLGYAKKNLKKLIHVF